MKNHKQHLENKNLSFRQVFETIRLAKLVRGVRASKLAPLAKNL